MTRNVLHFTRDVCSNPDHVPVACLIFTLGTQALRTDACKHFFNVEHYSEVANAMFTTPKTVERIWTDYVRNGHVIKETGARGFPRSPVPVYFSSQIDSSLAAKIEGWIPQMNKEDGGCTLPRLQAKILDEENLEVTPRVIRYTVKNKLGFKWGSCKKVPVVLRKNLARTGQIRRFLIEYHEALSLARGGDWVIVYMDETFANERHSSNFTWYRMSDTHRNFVNTGTGKGRRQIIIHAITSDGLLFEEDSERRSAYFTSLLTF